MIIPGDVIFYESNNEIKYAIGTFPVGGLAALQDIDRGVINTKFFGQKGIIFRPIKTSPATITDAVRYCFGNHAGKPGVPRGTMLYEYLWRLRFNDAMIKRFNPRTVTVKKLLQIIVVNSYRFEKM